MLWYDMWCIVNIVISREGILCWEVYIVYWVWDFVWDIMTLLILLILDSHKEKYHVVRVEGDSYNLLREKKKKVCLVYHKNSSYHINKYVPII